MNISKFNAAALSVSFDEDNLCLDLTDGRKLSVPLTYFPRLLNASPEQRAQLTVSGGGTGLHWDELDEDISVMGLLLGERYRNSAKREAA